MKPYIEVADETQRAELAKWDKAEKKGDIKSDIAKKLEGVDEATLAKVLELLKSAWWKKYLKFTSILSKSNIFAENFKQ